MKNLRKIRAFGAALVVAIAPVSLVTAEQWDLSDISKIALDGVSGDVIVRPADGGGARIELYEDVRPQGAFDVTVDQDGSTLRIEEEWRGSSSGKVEWTIYVPSGGEPQLDVDTASGSLDCRDVNVSIRFESASGSIELQKVGLGRDSDFRTASGDYKIVDMTVQEDAGFRTASGDIELERVEIEDGVTFASASGDVRAEGCTGHLNLKSASGDVVVRDSTVVGEGRFSSASGDVSLYLNGVPDDGLSASSASGKVLFDAGGLGGDYTLVMVADEKKGRIDCPLDFTSERTFERHDRSFDEKTVERGSGGPKIALETSSGSVIVKN